MAEEAPKTEGTPRNPGRRKLWIGGGVTLAVLLLAYLALAWFTTTRTPGGTTVAGVDVGGQDRATLIGTLNEEVAQLAAAPVGVRAAHATGQINPAAAGVAVDFEATADRLVGFTLTPATVFGRLGSGDAVTPVVTVDRGKLEAALAPVGEQVYKAPVDGAVSFPEGRIETVTPEDGTSLDLPAAAANFRTGWPGADPVEIPTRTDAPAIDRADLDETLTEFAEPAVAGPVTLDVGGTPVTLQPAQFAGALGVVAEEGELVGKVNGEAVKQALLQPGTGVAADPVNARFEIQDGVPTVIPGSNGVTIDPELARSAFTEAVDAEDRTATIETTVAEPTYTTEALQNAGVKEPMGEFSTRLSGSAGRIRNIRLAADTIDMSYLAPGETFSMNDTLGPRTRAKGYSAAPVIMNGIMDTGVGGGVSQVATTLFNASFFSGLEDVEHKPHSLYISRYPEGREATINYPDVDLKFRNDTGNGVLVQMWVGDGSVHARIWGTKQYDISARKSGRYAFRSPRTVTRSGPDCSPGGGSTGFSVDITRIFSQNDAEVKRETYTTTYIAGPRVVCSDQQD